ncbi:MAG: hypothetical protein OP8BY_1891 [Candidatus Saccharicenans subterraneus]|uniref:Uncharacterized protein n=1 Tax=Candidatus Saccharicenans subterraneus TaxID=2508984 RepID=A0A3E2BNS1_9BACT|nr:MAG: hypothetical protein OP8BY_1891 [Candidatus Saccharicenans subterraneum]
MPSPKNFLIAAFSFIFIFHFQLYIYSIFSGCQYFFGFFILFFV